MANIQRIYGPQGPNEPSKRVTDDTQMMLAVGEALVEAPKPYTLESFEPLLSRAFVDWSVSPDNNRAPGNTCMSACARLASRHTPWLEATVIESKGCGANMRVAPVGLLREKDGVDATTRAALAQFQSALTHGHPTALAASDLTAHAIFDLRQTATPDEILPRLRAYVLSQRQAYHHDWLGLLWQRARASSPESFISKGWDECLKVLDRLDSAYEAHDRDTDPCPSTGAGWIAEEAFATGLLCLLLYLDDPVAALRRAAVTSGDSDSIACLTGSFAGAYFGIDAWPPKWVETIEYHDRIANIARHWDQP